MRPDGQSRCTVVGFQAGAARKGRVLTLDTRCGDTLHLELRHNGEFYWFALSCVDFFVSRVGVPGFDKRDAWDNKVHSTIWRLWGAVGTGPTAV